MDSVATAAPANDAKQVTVSLFIHGLTVQLKYGQVGRIIKNKSQFPMTTAESMMAVLVFHHETNHDEIYNRTFLGGSTSTL